MRVSNELRTWTCVLALCALAGTTPGLAQQERSESGRGANAGNRSSQEKSRLALSESVYTRAIARHGEILIPLFNVPGLLPDARDLLLQARLCLESGNGSGGQQFWKRCSPPIATWEETVERTLPNPRVTAKALTDQSLLSTCGARYFIQWFKTGPHDKPEPDFVSSSFALKGAAQCQ
jgi:hypothetical protein